MAVEKNITWKKGKQYHFPKNSEAVGKNIKWGTGRKILGRKSRFITIRMGKNITL